MTTKIEKKGYKRYDTFVKKVLGHNKVMTPHSWTAGQIGEVNLRSDEYYNLCLSELLNNFNR